MVEFFKNRDLFLGALLGILLLTGIGLYYLARQLGSLDTTENENRYRNLPIQNWRSFSSAEGKFSILFPGVPDTTNLTAGLPAGNTTGHLFYANCGPQNSFAIEYEDSAKFMEPDVKKYPQEFLKKAENLSLPEAARVVFEQQSIIDGYPAREFECCWGKRELFSQIQNDSGGWALLRPLCHLFDRKSTSGRPCYLLQLAFAELTRWVNPTVNASAAASHPNPTIDT